MKRTPPLLHLQLPYLRSSLPDILATSFDLSTSIKCPFDSTPISCKYQRAVLLQWFYPSSIPCENKMQGHFYFRQSPSLHLHYLYNISQRFDILFNLLRPTRLFNSSISSSRLFRGAVSSTSLESNDYAPGQTAHSARF